MNAQKQNQILGWILADRSVCLQVLPFLKPEFFEDPKAQKCVKVLFDFIKERKQFPTISIIEAEVGFNVREEFPLVEPAEVEKEYVLRELEEFYKHSRLKQFLLEGVSMIESDSIDYGKLETSMKEIVKASLQVDLGLDYFSSILSRLEELDKPTYHLSTGYEQMDKMMNGGWEPSELHLIGGGTGQGKSIFLANFSANNVLRGKNVLMITLELSEPVFGLRYDQLFLNKTRDEIMYDKDKTNRMLTKIHEATGGSLTVKFYPTSSLRPSMVEAYLEFYMLHRGFLPDVIYIDYLSLMRPNGSTVGLNSYAIEKVISEELRGIAGTYNIPIISATQLNRAGMDSAIPGTTAVSDSIGKIFTVGSLLNISQTKAEKAMGLTKLYAAKMRNTRSDWLAKFKINYETLKITELEMILNMTEAEDNSSEQSMPHDSHKPRPLSKQQLQGIH